MYDVHDVIREPGSAAATGATIAPRPVPAPAAEVMLTPRGVHARTWRVVDQADAPAEAGTLVPLARWLTLRGQGGDLSQVGVIVAPDSDLAPLRVHLASVPVVGIHYPRFGDGRGYSHARRLRHLWGFTGALLAFGDVLRDQLVWMWRVGIDHFHLRADQDPVAAQRAFTLYSAFYQY